ncbi:unnamed protein product, partial [Ranitomeya imitator]
MSTSELQAPRTLQDDKNLIIKPADKGGAIVVMNRSDYVQEIQRQLNDDRAYLKLSRDHRQSLRDLISNRIPHQKSSHNTSVLHYPQETQNLEHPLGRPIVASTESILSPLSIFLEKILAPHIKKSPCFLLDT